MKYIRLNEDLTTATGLTYDKTYVSYNNTSYESQFLRPQRPVETKYNVGDIIYWSGSQTPYKSISYTEWDSSLGTPEAIVVIPASHMSDGKTRAIALTNIDKDGKAVTDTDTTTMEWDTAKSNQGTSGIYYTVVPTWSNDAANTYATSNNGCLPSDKFAGTTCYNDTNSRYYTGETSNLIPSPYLTDGTVNSNYSKTLGGGNALGDFNGKSETTNIIASSTTALAAIACNKYKSAHTSAGDWYLPSLGELGHLVAKRTVIEAAITAACGLGLADYIYLSSTEYSLSNFYYIVLANGYVSTSEKTTSMFVRPFIQI